MKPGPAETRRGSGKPRPRKGGAPVVLGVLLGAVLVAAGCGDAGGERGWTGEVRDSAGIAVVENAAEPLWDEDERWRVEEDLTVGGDESRPETLFGHVADLDVDGAGQVYMLDQQAQAVRVFAPDGSTERTVGGPGEGPGELGRFAATLMVRDDTVMVVDWGQGRLSRFSTADGAFLGSEPLPTAGGARSWWAVTPDGFVFRSLARYTDDEGRWLGRDALLRYRGGEEVDTLLVFEYAQSDLGTPAAPNVPVVVNAPSWTVLDDGRIAWLALEEERVRIHGPDGTLRTIVTSAAWTAREPTEAEGERMREKLGEKLEMLGGSRDIVDRLPVEVPERLPAVTSVRAGPAGTLWVQRMGGVDDLHPMALNSPDPPTGLGGGTWDVLDGEGRYLGSLRLPDRLRVLRITDDAVYGVRRDALDVERVVRLRIVR